MRVAGLLSVRVHGWRVSVVGGEGGWRVRVVGGEGGWRVRVAGE